MNKERDNEWAYRLIEERAERTYNHLPKFLARLMLFRNWSLESKETMDQVEIFFKRNFAAQMEWVTSELDSDDSLTKIVAHRYLADIELALMLLLREIKDKDARVSMYLSLLAGYIFMKQLIEMDNISQTAQSLACCYLFEMQGRIDKIRDLIFGSVGNR